MTELRNILKENDYTLLLTTTQSVGNILSRTEIESILTENGVTFPVQDVGYFIEDRVGKFFSVTYMADNHKYYYIKMKNA